MTELVTIGKPEYGDVLLPQLNGVTDLEEFAINREIIRLQNALIPCETFVQFLACLAMQRIDPTWNPARTARLQALLVINLANFMFDEMKASGLFAQLSNLQGNDTDDPKLSRG